MICNRLKECIHHEHSQNSHAQCASRTSNTCIISADKRPLIKCEENHKKYTLENTQKYFVISYKIDGGVIIKDKTVPEGIKKCDYLYILCSDNRREAILIELKGKDVPKALEQIKETLNLFSDALNTCQHVYARIVVMSSMPNLKARPEYVNLVKMLRQTYHGNLKICERAMTEKDVALNN